MKAKYRGALTCFIRILFSLCLACCNESRLNYLCNCVTWWDKGRKTGRMQVWKETSYRAMYM